MICKLCGGTGVPTQRAIAEEPCMDCGGTGHRSTTTGPGKPIDHTRRIRDWEVTLFIEETEGVEATQPWYQPGDIKDLLQHAFHKAGRMRDLRIKHIHVDPPKEPHYEQEEAF